MGHVRPNVKAASARDLRKTGGDDANNAPQAAGHAATVWHPHRYQKTSSKFLVDRGAAILLLDPGLGKTSAALDAFRRLRKAGTARRALVVAPLRVCHEVWPAEARKWSAFSDLRVGVWHGTPKDRAAALDGTDVVAVNPEGLRAFVPHKTVIGPDGRHRVVPNPDAFRSYGFDTLIVDELSKFKHGTTERFRIVNAIAGTFARRWGLTGSPAANGLLDLFSQVLVIDGGRTFGPWFRAFRARYFVPLDRAGWTWAPKHGAADAIAEALRPLALRMSAEDYLELPPLVETEIVVDLPKSARKKYLLLEAALVASVRGGTVSAANAAVASSKCRQVASGSVYLDADVDRPSTRSRWAPLHEAKLDALLDLVDELSGAPLLLAYEFRHEAERIASLLPDGSIVLRGGDSTKTVASALAAWGRGEVPVLAAHPASLGHGVNLQGGGCAHVAFFSTTWDFELYDQFLRRVWRQGSTAGRVVVHRIVARDTVDEVVIRALRAKDNRQRVLLDGIKALGSQR